MGYVGTPTDEDDDDERGGEASGAPPGPEGLPPVGGETTVPRARPYQPRDGAGVREQGRAAWERHDPDDNPDDDVVDALIEKVERDDAGGTDVELDEGFDDELDGPRDADGELEYELDAWAVESREMLDQLLNGAGIARVWQGGTLVVRAEDEAATDELVDQVETTTLPTLDPEAEKVAYEIADFDAAKADHLFDLLEGQDIAYEIDVAGDLVVLASSEDAVDVIMEAIDYPHAIGVDSDEQLDAAGLPLASDVLSDLFVAADRLKNKATDHKGVLGLVDAAEVLPSLKVPYGFDGALWRTIGERTGALCDLLEDEDSTDSDIEEAAAGLRRLLADFV